MTAAEWGRVQASAPAEPAAVARPTGLAGMVESGAAALLLLLLSQALLGPLFNPTQADDAGGWLRSMWLPIYGVILLLAVLRAGALRGVWIGALLTAPLLLLAFASSEWSVLPDVTQRRAIALGFTTLFGLWLAARFTWREVIGLLAGVYVVLAIGSYLAALAAPELGVHSDLHPGAWRGLWYEKNTLGAVMAQGALACACAALLLPAYRWLWIGGAVLCAGLVLLSTSTTSLLALVMIGVGAFTVAGLRRGGASAVTTAWMVLVAIGVAAGAYALAPEAVFEALGKDPTLTGRTDIWGAVLRQVEERPLLGYGFGAFWEDKGGAVGFVRNEVDWSAPTAHNGWLELLLSFGWTGVALFGLHLLAVATAAVISLGRGPHAYWALIFLILFALYSLSESTIMQQNNLSWALYVMTAAKLFGRREAAPPAERPARRSKPLATPRASWAPASVTAALPASRLSFFMAVGALLVFSKIWLPIVFGGPAPETVGGQVQIVYVFAYLAAAALALSRPGETLQLLLRQPLVPVLVLAAAVSVFWSIAPGDTAVSVIALAATTLAGVALAARFSWSQLAEVFAAAFAVVVIGALGAGLLAPDIGRQATYDGAWRGLFGHKNNLGGAMAVAVPLFAAAAAYNRRRLWLWTGFGVLASILLVLSDSKTALMATIVGMGALAATGLVRRGGLTAVATSYAVLLLVMAGALFAVFAGEASLAWLGKDSTLTGRTEIWDAAMRQIEERPWLGFGYSTLWDPADPNTPTAWMFLEARHEMSHAHNSWLEIWLGVGVVGAIVFTLLLLKTWAEALAAVYRHGAALLATPFLLAYTVTALTESVALTYNDLRWVMFTAIAVKLARWGQDPMASASDPERRTSA